VILHGKRPFCVFDPQKA